MNKQTQEQFLETIDGLLAINEQLRKDLADREAECLKLREALEEFPTSFHTLPKDESCKCSQCQAIRGKQKAISAPPSPSYLEQWEKEHYQVVGYFGYEKVHGLDVRSFSGHQCKLHNALLYARKD